MTGSWPLSQVDRDAAAGTGAVHRLVVVARRSGRNGLYPGRVFVLTLDTATPAVTAGVVDVGPRSVATLAEHVTVDRRAHGELLMPQALEAVRSADVTLRGLQAIVCGVGPGPYTGLRVGVMTASALSHSLGIPAYPVCSLDAIAFDVDADEPFIVLTDARRREVYWASYDASAVRITGPHVGPVTDIDSGVDRRVEYDHPTPSGLAAAAQKELVNGEQPAALAPAYLRRPHVAEPGPVKRVGI